MELRDAISRRRMVRSFDGTPVDPDWLEEACALALRAPTAGNSAGVRFAVLGAERVGDYLERATDPEWRARSRRAGGLSRAGAVVLVTVRVGDYLARYDERDKAASGLADRSAWPLPYWHGDAAMATMNLLLLLEEGGWHATLWGNFRHGDDVLAWAGLVDEELFATVLIGRSDGSDEPSPSLARPVPTREARVRRLNP